MSSNLEDLGADENISKSSKKRKHDGAPKESRKKRKQLDIALAPEAVDENEGKKKEATRDHKKDKKRKQKDLEILDNTDAATLLNGDKQHVSSTRRAAKTRTDSNTSKASQTSHPTNDQIQQVDVADRTKDSGIELAAEGSSNFSATIPRKDKKKRKREAQVEEPSIPLEVDADVEPISRVPESEIKLQEIDPQLDKTSVRSEEILNTSSDLLNSDTPTSFYSTRLSLYLSIPSIATLNPLSGMLSLHLTPLLLTYFPPAGGVVLSYYDPVLSAKPEAGLNKPLMPPSDSQTLGERPTEILTKVGDEAGACWAWLTVTFLIFKPEHGDELKGWTNVLSEGFIGLVCYNYFQAAVSRARIPRSWTWSGASRYHKSTRKATRKGKLNDTDEMTQGSMIDFQDVQTVREDDATDGGIGTFLDESGDQIPESTAIRVVDLEIVPAADKGKWSLQIEGTLLDEGEEAEMRNEERQKFEDRNQSKPRLRSRFGTPLMSGGLPAQNRDSSILSTG